MLFNLKIRLSVSAAITTLVLSTSLTACGNGDYVSGSSNADEVSKSTSNTSQEDLLGQECENPDEVRVIGDTTYKCVGHGAFYWQIDNESGNGDNSYSSGDPIEDSIRGSLRNACNSLPYDFSDLVFQEKGRTFNNYGDPLVIYGLGLLRISVYDAGDYFHWGPFQEADAYILDTWNCRYPSDASK